VCVCAFVVEGGGIGKEKSYITTYIRTPPKPKQILISDQLGEEGTTNSRKKQNCIDNKPGPEM
jgi:hypothetical protein